MNIRAGLEEYILQTHNTIFFEDSMERGFEPPPLNPTSGYASVFACVCSRRKKDKKHLFERRGLVGQLRLQLADEHLQSGTFFLVALMLSFQTVLKR